MVRLAFPRPHGPKGCYLANRLEQVQVRDEDGNQRIVEIIVQRVLSVCVDCGCYPHGGRANNFEIIITPGGAYVRSIGEHAFRELDVAGPITLSIERVYVPH